LCLCQCMRVSLRMYICMRVCIQKAKPPVDMLDSLYTKYAGMSAGIDARDLRGVLNEAFQQVLGKDQFFDLETCRSLLSMLDTDQSGLLEMKELRRLWTELLTWREVFVQFDKDKSGFIDAVELKNIFISVGYSLSRGVLTTLIRRYGGKECRLYFNEFVLAVTKVVSIVDLFPSISKNGLKGKAELSLDELLQTALYL